ncbi:MAG: Gfo/Idh/MocA family oxidoreductase [Planctomycetales bacterium]|nr:Gfo/Idh/MocA family oxidoreductase [Planctomycetales bacterium]
MNEFEKKSLTRIGSYSRRKVLSGVAATVAGASFSVVPSQVLGLAGQTAANERINLGVIGIGPRCTYDLTSILKFEDVRCVAIADVQQTRREAGKKLVDTAYGNSDCKLYLDFRELLVRQDIDAVLIATGDRWHAAASILAAEAGKDVYSEKPCGITIRDCQQLSATMDSQNRIFQAGTQRRSVRNFQVAVDLVHSGKLGKLHTMHASVYTPVLDNAWLPAEKQPARDVIDWNMWLGPAPWRPFNQAYVNGKWRGQWDFDSGARLLDWGAHTVDLCQWASQSDHTMPITYEPMESGIHCYYENGVKLVIDFLKDPFGNRDPHYITRLGTCPVRFIGDEGSVETGDNGEIVVSSSKLEKELPEGLERIRGLDVSEHARNFFDSIRSRRPTVANQNVMRRSHIACHAAAIAWILQRKLRLDPDSERFIDDDSANSLISRSPRVWA